jgi:hypothetical protein
MLLLKISHHFQNLSLVALIWMKDAFNTKLKKKKFFKPQIFLPSIAKKF